MTHETEQDLPAPSPLTLGDVLYTDSSKRLVSEASWIELVQAIAGGDQSALHALYERAHRVVFTLILRLTGNPAIAEELTVDVFHGAWQRAASYDPRNGTVLGWLMNQARSRAIDRLRYEQRRKRVKPHDHDSPAPDTPAGAEDVLELARQGEWLRDALYELTPDERQAIEAAYFGELSHAEVAARLNQPLGTVKTRIRSGLYKLRLAMAAKTRKA